MAYSGRGFVCYNMLTQPINISVYKQYPASSSAPYNARKGLAEDDVFMLNDGTECSTELMKAMTDNYYSLLPEDAEEDPDIKDPDIKDAIKGTALEAQYKMLVDRCTKEDSMKGTECVRRMMDSQVTKVHGKVVMIVWLCGCVCGLSRWSLTR